MANNANPLIAYGGGVGTNAILGPAAAKQDFGTSGFTNLSYHALGLYWVQIVRFSGGAEGVWGTRWSKWPFVHSFLDPTGVRLPYTLRIEDIVSAEFIPATDGRVFFGIGDFADVADPASLRGVGFVADFNSNWRGYAADDTGVLVDLDLGVVAAATINHLRVDIDGSRGEVRWYVDNVQVGAAWVPAVPLGDLTGASSASQGPQFGGLVQNNTTVGDVDILLGGGGLPAVQLVLVSQVQDPVPVAPIVVQPTDRLTYQRVLNIARQRAPEFQALVLDDQQVMDELNAITLELVQEGSDADHTVFQEVMKWSTDVLPNLEVEPAPVDLRDVAEVRVPRWVNSVYAGVAYYANGKTTKVSVVTRERPAREQPWQEEWFLPDFERPANRPRAYKVWDPAESQWLLLKDTTGSANPWTNIVDVDLVVSGSRLRMTTRASMNDAIPLPFQAMRPLAEMYALILGSRAGKDPRWMADQRLTAENCLERFRAFINLQDMSTDEPYDPEVGYE